MPRYFFDTHDGELICDEEGTVCNTFGEIRSMALKGLADFAHDAVPDAQFRTMSVRVRDAKGDYIMSVTLKLSIDTFQRE